MNSQNTYTRGVLLCLLATVSWGAMFPLMDSTLQHIDPFTFTVMRYTIAGAMFLVFLRLREGRADCASRANASVWPGCSARPASRASSSWSSSDRTSSARGAR